jgi:hypothetical protein
MVTRDCNVSRDLLSSRPAQHIAPVFVELESRHLNDYEMKTSDFIQLAPSVTRAAHLWLRMKRRKASSNTRGQRRCLQTPADRSSSDSRCCCENEPLERQQLQEKPDLYAAVICTKAWPYLAVPRNRTAAKDHSDLKGEIRFCVRGLTRGAISQSWKRLLLLRSLFCRLLGGGLGGLLCLLRLS